MSQHVQFETRDSVKIAASYYEPATSSEKGIILVHMMPEAKESWKEFAPKLTGAGFHALAIDLRGHGQSGGGDFRNFSDREHQASVLDIEAAAKFLVEKGVSKIGVIGASIGANLVLQYLAESPSVKLAVLLSPGLDYRGVEIVPLAEKVLDKSKILLIGAEDDAAGMGASCEELASLCGGVEKICYESGGHGTNLFDTHPELGDKILDFLKPRLAG